MASTGDDSTMMESDAITASGSLEAAEEESRPDSQMVANAALARAVQPKEGDSEADGMLPLDLRLPFHRCLNSIMFRPMSNDVKTARATATLATLEVLLSNALLKGVSGPLETKYLQIKLSNPAIKSKLGLDLKQYTEGTGAPALDWLYLCGWRHSVKDFQEYCTFPASPSERRLEELRTGLHLLTERLAREREQAELKDARKMLAQAEEDSRKERALLQYKEDRQIQKDRNLWGRNAPLQ